MALLGQFCARDLNDVIILSMTFESINAEEAIESIQKQMKADKSLSPSLANSINVLILLVKILISRIGPDSKNSSLPPSSNNPRKIRGKDKKKRKKKSAKSVGGQDGHKGSTLEQFEEVNEIIPLSVDRRTLPVGISFTQGEPENRQVIDLNLEFIVTEYQAEVLVGSDGHRYVATFPRHITKAIQYSQVLSHLPFICLSTNLFPTIEFKKFLKISLD